MRYIKYIFVIFLLVLLSCCASKSDRTAEVIAVDTVAAPPVEEISNVKADSTYEYHDKYMKGDAEVKSSTKGKVKVKVKPIKKMLVVDLDKIQNGKIVYYIPDSMMVDKTYRIYMTLALPQKSVKLTIAEQKNPYEKIDTTKIVVDNVKFGNTMYATLKDPTKSFNITPIGDEIKVLDFKLDTLHKYEIWLWDIVPLKEGSIPLILSVEIVVNKDGVERKTNMEVFNKQLIIKSEPVPFWIKVWNFFVENWQWFLSTLIIPFGIWYYNKKKKKE